MKITWKRCRTYADARDHSGVIYLHEWNGSPFYWGKAHRSFFGGHHRTANGLTASGRYNGGYRHWIEGCLQHGARLYIGLLDDEALLRIDDLERFLTHSHGHAANTRVPAQSVELHVTHEGDIPASVLRGSEVTPMPIDVFLAWLLSIFQGSSWTCSLNHHDGYVEAQTAPAPPVILWPRGEVHLAFRLIVAGDEDIRRSAGVNGVALAAELNDARRFGCWRFDELLGLQLEHSLPREALAEPMVLAVCDHLSREALLAREVWLAG